MLLCRAFNPTTARAEKPRIDNKIMNWPAEFPNDCPPASALAHSGDLFRFVSASGPSAEDFQSQQQINPTKVWEGILRCQSCGLSVFTDLDGVARARKMVPALRRKPLAKASLTGDQGSVLSTPSKTNNKHHTWWLVDTVSQPHALFSLCEQTWT
jgi:hypothetical protein